jgi:predicted N-acetyltransferase YhbS
MLASTPIAGFSVNRPQTFKELLDREIHYYLNLKRLAELQLATIRTCGGKTIENDLLYEQLLFASIDGLFTRLHNFGERLIVFFNIVKAGYLDSLKRNNRRGLEVDPNSVNVVTGPDDRVARSVARDLTGELQRGFLERYDARFPGVSARNSGAPNHADVDAVVETLREVLVPINRHRDKVVAHWDDQAVPATVKDLEKALAHIESLLSDLFLFSQLGTYVFELGGAAADVERTTTDLCELILGEFRVRKAADADMDSVYMMGYDTWGDGQSKTAYLEGCRTSPKYAAGTWYVLEDREGEPLSALIVYNSPNHGLQENTLGIGSLATKLAERGKGYANHLMWDLMRSFLDRNHETIFYLFADVNSKFYEALDFKKLPEHLQTKVGSTAMARCLQSDRLQRVLESAGYRPPSYF